MVDSLVLKNVFFTAFARGILSVVKIFSVGLAGVASFLELAADATVAIAAND